MHMTLQLPPILIVDKKRKRKTIFLMSELLRGGHLNLKGAFEGLFIKSLLFHSLTALCPDKYQIYCTIYLNKW